MPLPPEPLDPLNAFRIGIRAGDRVLQAVALRKLAWLRHQDGRNTDALRTMRTAAERAAELGPGALGQALMDLGRLLLALHRPVVAETAARRAVEALHKSGDGAGAAVAQQLRAEALAASGHTWLAESACVAAAAAWQQLGDTRRAAEVAIAAARIAMTRADRERALEWLLEAVPALVGRDDDEATWARGELGALLFQRAEAPEAIALLEQAAEEDLAAGRHDRAARRLHMLGRAHGAAGRLAPSRRALASAIEAWRFARNPAGEAATVAALAELLADAGRPFDAVHAAERAIDLATRITFPVAAERAVALLLRLDCVDAITRSRCARLLREAGWSEPAGRLEPG